MNKMNKEINKCGSDVIMACQNSTNESRLPKARLSLTAGCCNVLNSVLQVSAKSLGERSKFGGKKTAYSSMSDVLELSLFQIVNLY